jgi:hypothetical protein
MERKILRNTLHRRPFLCLATGLDSSPPSVVAKRNEAPTALSVFKKRSSAFSTDAFAFGPESDLGELVAEIKSDLA